MKKLLTLFLGLGFLSQPASAVMVLGEDFAGYVNSVGAIGGDVVIDTGAGPSSSPAYSIAPSDVTSNITDMDAGSWVIGNSAGAYLDLGLSAAVADLPSAIDMKIFLVGANGHSFDLTIGGTTKNYLLGAKSGQVTGAFDSIYGTDPVVAVGIDLVDFGLSGPVDTFRITFDDGWGCKAPAICSAVPSFIGTYNAVSAVPVPAAVWLFGSGLLGLVGFVRRRRA